jgi:cell division protein FtsI (penicillin-binding protein 3)
MTRARGAQQHPIPVRRAAVMGAILMLGTAGIGVRLGYVQVVRAETYATQARQQTIRKIELPARRGTIYDRTGGELAVSVPARTIYANPRFVTDPAKTADALAPLLKREVGAIEADLRKDAGFVYLARRVGLVTSEKIESLGLVGIGVLSEPRRLYPGKSLASNVVGFVGTDQNGLSGLEYGYEELLGGRPGFRILEQDPRGRRIPQGEFTEVPPVAGSDVVLTIHPDIQMSAERELAAAVERTGAKGGMLVALDPRNGEILAMVSNPTFDANVIEEIDEAQTRNRVVTEAFEPGSVSKIVAAAAALNEGIVSPQTIIEVPGALTIGDKTFIDEHNPGGPMDLRQILAKSANLGTIRLAQMLGRDRLFEYMQRLGYGRGTGLGFPGESAGNLPPIGRWSTALPTMAIGQSLAVTELQIAQVYAMIANDGVSVEPRLVSGWVDPEGERHEPQSGRSRRVLPPDVARTLRSMLKSTITEGTGKLAAVPHHEVAGKTGTARRSVEGVGYQGYMSSFVGMVPANHPQLVIGVVLDDPNPIEGGLVAAPVFSEVAKDAVHILRIPPAS